MKNTAFQKNDFYFISEVASLLHVSTHTIRNLETEFNIEVKKDINGKRIYTFSDVENYRILLERKNDFKDVNTLKSSSKLLSVKNIPTEQVSEEGIKNYSDEISSTIINKNNFETIIYSFKNAFSSSSLSRYALALSLIVSFLSFGSFYLDSYLDINPEVKSSNSKNMSNVLQSTNTTWDYRFDVNIPAFFNNSLYASSASMDLIKVGDNVVINPQGIKAPNIVNTINADTAEKNIIVNNTDVNNPLISLNKNLTFGTITIDSLKGVKTLDDTTITTIQDAVGVAEATTDSKTLEGLAATDFLRSNADTVFSNGIMTFDASSSIKFNNLNPNTFVRVGSDNKLVSYTIEPGLNVSFGSTATSLTINIATGAASNTFTSVAVQTLFLGGTSFDNTNLITATASELNKLHSLTGNVLTSDNLTSLFTGIDTNASDDITSSNIAASILAAFPNIDTYAPNKVIVSSLAQLMLTQYPNLDTDASNDVTSSNLASSIYSLFPNIDTNATDDLNNAVMVDSTAGKEVYSTNTWYGTQTFNYVKSSLFEVITNGKIVLNPGAVPGIYNNSVYNNNDRLYFEDLPLIQVYDTIINNDVNRIAYFVTDASGRLTIRGVDNVALSQIVSGTNNQILGMNGSNLSYLTVNGDLSVSTTSSSNITFTLNTVNSSTGTYGSESYIPQITVNSKGLITGISTIAVSVASTSANNYVTAISFVDTSASNKSLVLSRNGLSDLTATFTINNSDVVTALGFTPFNAANFTSTQIINTLGYTPLNSTAFNAANITNALGYVPFGPSNFVAGTNISLSSTATSLTINSSYVDTTNANNYVTGISFTDSNATSKVLTLTRNGLADLTSIFSISAANVTSALGYTPFNSANFTAANITNALNYVPFDAANFTAANITNALGYVPQANLGYTPLNSTAFNSANITNALGYVPFGPSNFIAGTNVTLSSTATSLTINASYVDTTNANNYVTGISFTDSNATSKVLTLTRNGLADLTSIFSISAANVTSALGYTPLNSTAFNAANITGALNYVPFDAANFTAAYITNALGYIPQVNLGYTPFDAANFTSTQIINTLGYTPLNSTAFNAANITNALGYVPFGPSNFVAGTNISLSSTATSLTINSSYVDTTNANNYVTGISFTDSNATSKVLTLTRNGLADLTSIFSISAANVTSALGYTPLNSTAFNAANITGALNYVPFDAANFTAAYITNALGYVPQANLGYTPLNSTAFNAANITNALGYVPFGPSNFVAGTNISLSSTATSLTINSSYVDTTNANNYVTGISFTDSNATSKVLTLTRNGLADLTSIFSISAANVTSALGYTPLGSANFVAGGNVSLSSTATSLTITVLTAPSSISGTKDYIPFFDTKNSITASDVYYNHGATERALELISQSKIDTYLGIGHSNQYSLKLGVASSNTGTFTNYDSEDDVVLLNVSNTSQSDMLFALNNDAGKMLFIFGKNASQRAPFAMTYNNGTHLGNFGINTTAPSTQLDVVGSAKISGTLANKYFSNPSTNSFEFLTGANFNGNLSAARATFTSLSLANALPVIFGGTGLTAVPNNGQLLIGNGAGYTLAPITAGTNITISTSAGGITINAVAGATNANNYVTGIAFTDSNSTSKLLTLNRFELADLTAIFSISDANVTSALGYTPLNSTAFNSANITNALGYVPFGPSNFVAGTNISLSSTATSLTINSSYVDTTNANNYVTGISFTDSNATSKVLTLTRNGLADLTSIFSISAANVTSALGYTPFDAANFTAAYITNALNYVPFDAANFTAAYITNALGYVPQANLGYTPLNSTAFNAANITNALGYVPFSSSSFTGLNIINALGYTPLSSTDTFADNAVNTMYSNYYTIYDVETDSIKGFIDYAFYKDANFKFGNSLKIDPIAQSMSSYYSAEERTFYHNFYNGDSVIFGGSTYFGTTEVIQALGYTPFDNLNFNAENITNALGYIPFNAANFTAAYITNALGYVPQANLGYTPLNSTAFNAANITNALGYVPFGPSNFIAGTNVTLSSTATSLTIESSYVDTNYYPTSIAFTNSNAGTKVLTLNRNGQLALTAAFSLSSSDITTALGYTPLQASDTAADKFINSYGLATNVASQNISYNFSLGRNDGTTFPVSFNLTPLTITTALGYTPLNSTAFNAANITNALGYVPFGPSNFIAGTNVTLSSTATSLTIESSYVDTNYYPTSIAFTNSNAGTKVLTLNRNGQLALTAAFSLSSSDITTALGYTPLQASDTAADKFINSYGLATNVASQNISYNFSLGRNDGTTFPVSFNLTPLTITTALGYTPLNSTAFNAANITNALGYVPFGPSNFIAGTNVTLSSTATSLTIESSYVDTNYYPTSIAFTNSNAGTKVLTLNRNGQLALTAAFSLSSSDITTALGYTPLKNTTDFLTGNLGVSGNFSAANIYTDHLFVSDYQNTAYKLSLETNVNGSNKTLRFDMGSSDLSNATIGINLQSVNFTAPSNNAVKNLTFNQISLTDNITVDIFKSGTLPAIISGTLDTFGANISGATAKLTNLSLANALPVIFGGTGLTAVPNNGQLLIGNGNGYTLSNLVAGSNISITTNAGSIQIDSSYVDTNNYVTSLSFDDTTSTSKTLTINRNGTSPLTAVFSISASTVTTALGYTPLNSTAFNAANITGALNYIPFNAANFTYTQIINTLGYTPLKNITDSLTGNLGVSGNFSAALGKFDTIATGYFSTPLANRTFSFGNSTISVRDLNVFRIGTQDNPVNTAYFGFIGSSSLTASNSLSTTGWFSASDYANFYNNVNLSSTSTLGAGIFSSPLANRTFDFTIGTISASYLNLSGDLNGNTANFGGNLSAALGNFSGLGVNGNFSASNGYFSTGLTASTAFINGYFSAGASSLGATTVKGNLSAAVGFFTTVATSTFSNPVSGSFSFLAGANFLGNISAANGTFITLSAQSLNINNLFTVDSTGSIFNNGVTFNDTIEFNAIGDLAVANDLVFTNLGASKIKTATDLSIEVGEPFNSSNLTISTFNNGVITFNGNSTFRNNLYAGETYFNPVDSASEGGQVWFSGPTSSYESWFVDVYQDKFRIIKPAGAGNGSTNTVQIFNNGGVGQEAGLGVQGASAFGNVTPSGNYTLEVLGNFSAGTSSLGTTRINGNLTGTGNILLGASSHIVVGFLSAPTAGAATRLLITYGTTQGSFAINSTASSDVRLKDAIQPYTNSVETLMKLDPVSFNYRNIFNLDITLPGRSFGFIAQDVEKVLPEIVLEDSVNVGGVSYKGIDYGRLTPILVGAIKEQQAQINSLSAPSVIYSNMQDLMTTFTNTLNNLSMSTENGALVVNTNLTVTGRSLFNNASFTGDVTIGQMKFDSLNNSLSINGSSCVNIDGTLNNSLCNSQTLYLMKNKAGNLNIFDGKVVINPKGELTVEKIQAGEVAAAKVKAEEYQVVAGSEVSGNSNILTGQTEITILTSKVKSNSKIFVTANSDLNGKSIYVSNKVEGVSFTVKLNQAIANDINFDWFILNIE